MTAQTHNVRVRLPACPLPAPSSLLYALSSFICCLLGLGSYLYYGHWRSISSFCPKLISCRLQGMPSACRTGTRESRWPFLSSVTLGPGPRCSLLGRCLSGLRKLTGVRTTELIYFFSRKRTFLQGASSMSHGLSEPGCSVFAVEMGAAAGARDKGLRPGQR